MKRERLEGRRAWDRSIVLVSIGALFFSSGCSFMFLDRPHDSYARYEPIPPAAPARQQADDE